MHALRAGALLVIAACGGGGDDVPIDLDAEPAAPALNVFPSSMTQPPGAWSDAILRTAGDPVVGTWTLELDGLPEGVTGRFDPPELTDGSLGAALLLDLAPDAPASTTFITARATSGDRAVEVMFDLTVRAHDGDPDFAVYARAPIKFLASGTLHPVPSSGEVDADVRVVSLGGFTGDVHLTAAGPLVPAPVEPGTVTLTAGGVADAVAHLARGAEDGVSLSVIRGAHRLVSRIATSFTVSGIPDDATPTLRFAMPRHTWLAAGDSIDLAPTIQPWMISETPSLVVEDAEGVTATVSGTSVQVSATGAGGHRVEVRATAGSHTVRSYAHVAVPRDKLAAPLTAGGVPTLIVDGTGTEVRYRTTAGWSHISSANGFATPVAEGNVERHVHPGVLEGRVTVDLANGNAHVIETRTDVGTRTWLPIVDAGAQPVVAYDASNELFVVGRAFGPLAAWRRAGNGTITPTTTGLPSGLVDAGPWLGGGGGPPVIVFVQAGRLQAFAWGGAAWVAYPDLPVTELAPVDVDVVVDPTLGAIAAVRDGEGALAVWRYAGGDEWTDLALPTSSAAVVTDVAITRDATRVVVAWVEVPHVDVQDALGVSGARAFVSIYEGGGWSAVTDLTLDPGAVPSAPALAFAPDGLYAAWTEAGSIVLELQ